MTFQITALPLDPFAPLFALDDESLAGLGARRVIADGAGFPCRVSLADAAPGERVILLNYEHQPAPTPFRASHAIYVRERATLAAPAAGEVPAMLHTRLLSLRGFDDDGMLRAADAVAGTEVEAAINAMFADPAVAYVHLHFAKAGCYAARVDRA